MAFARATLKAAEESLPPYSHPKSPHKFTQRQLFAMLALRVFLKTDYRGVINILEDWDFSEEVRGAFARQPFRPSSCVPITVISTEQVRNLFPLPPPHGALRLPPDA